MSIVYSGARLPERQVLLVAFCTLSLVSTLAWLIDSQVIPERHFGLLVQQGDWAYFASHLVQALAGTLILYLFIRPLFRRLAESEAGLRAALRRNELILTHAGEGIYGLDAGGKLTFVNHAAEQMLGYSRQHFGRPIVSDLIPGRRCQVCAQAVEACPILATLRDGSLHRCDDAVFLRSDGRPLQVQYISAPIREDDAITGAVVVFNDNTARKQNEATLARWQHIFDHAEWGVIVYDVRAGKIELMNPAFLRMHGYEGTESVEWSVDAFFAEDCRADIPPNVRLVHEKGHHVWESWHVRQDGTRFPVQIDATAVKDDAGQVLYRVVNVQDITERRRAEDVLRENEAHLARAQAQGKLGSWQLDLVHDVLEWSAECYRIFGLPPDTVVTYQRFLDCVHPDDRARVARAWRAAVGGDPYDIQHRIVADGQVKWVRERAELEFAADGSLQRGTGTVQDITELKRHEEALLRSRQNLRELAAHHEQIREAERAHIAREIHDELGQYLTALRMDTALLKMRFASDNAELARTASAMIATIDTTIGVVRNLAARLRPAALDNGLVAAAEWLLAEFEKRFQIHCRLYAPKTTLEIDEPRCVAAFRILQESLTNISRHANAGEATVRIERVGDVLELDIADDGVGFDPAEVRARRTFGMLGMRERAIQFGGESRIESCPGAGTRLYIRIPCTGTAQ